jgi:AraC-like DNA-binding protein
MLIGKKELSAPGVLFRFHIVLERNFRLFAVERRGTVFDSRFLRGADRMGGGTVAFFLLLDGWIEWHDGAIGPLEGPAAFVSRVDDPSATKSTRSSGGEPYRAIDLVLLDEPTVSRDRLQTVAFSESTWDAAREVFDKFDETPNEAVRRFVRAIDDAGVGVSNLESSIVDREDPFIDRVWGAFLELDLLASPFPSFQDLVDRSGVSASHFARKIKDLLTTFRFDWVGWRDVTNDARLRWALILISNDDLSVADVAHAAGYGSTDALDATFRRSGLPSPREVRRAISSTVKTR